MWRLLAAVTAFLLIISPSMAWAQESGTLITHRPAGMNGTSRKDTRTTMRDFGRCVVAHSPGTVEKIITLHVDTPEYDRMLSSAGIEDCLGEGELRIPPSIMRGSLFEASYIRHFGRSGPTDFSAVKPIDYFSGYPEKVAPEVQSIIAMSQFGDCVVRADAADAKALIISAPETPDETTMFAALAPVFGPCVAQGQKVVFSKTVLRGALAEGLYRLSIVAALP
jgi:hypothetical protein